jgi:hypothetical protein
MIDMNIVVRSSSGASYHFLDRIAADAVDFAISVPLFLEYEDGFKGPANGGLIRWWHLFCHKHPSFVPTLFQRRVFEPLEMTRP